MCGATAGNGVDIVAELLGLDRILSEQDLVIVGEGSFDLQSIMGKTPVGVARHARDLGVPAVAVVGRNLLEVDAVQSEGIEVIGAAADVAPSPSDSLREPARWLAEASRQLIARLDGAAPAGVKARYAAAHESSADL
jgi:glycerate kinase